MTDNLTPSERLEKHQEEVERRELLEHQQAISSINYILQSPEGKKFFKYLFKTLDVTGLPDIDIPPDKLQGDLGFLRAGRSIYQLACQADPETSALLLTNLEREKHDNANELRTIQHECHSYTSYDDESNGV